MDSTVLFNIVSFEKDTIFDSSSDEDDDKARLIPKIENFAEYTVPRFTSNQFRQHFRLLPDTFEKVLGYLCEIKNKEQPKLDGRQEIYLEKQFLVTIWYLSNLESLRSVASRFNISKSTCWDLLQRTAHRLLKVNKLYGIIRWPTEEEALQTIRTFERKNNFPGIIGCIDSSHIKILAPKHFANSYINRKKHHSVLVQGVCNHKKLFTDIYAGEPGSLHDSNLYTKSDLYEQIRRGTIEFYNNSHLIGDLAYKLTTTLIVGFKNFGNLTQRQKNFNKKLNANRVEIENAFAFLKGRFRRLKFIETMRLDFVSVFIVAAAILHNAGIMNDDLPSDYVNVEEELAEERRNNVINIHDYGNIDNNAIEKRLNILYNLPL